MRSTWIAFGIAVSLATIVAACDGRNAARPTPLPTQVTYSLTGYVTEPVDVPVAGAVITVQDGPHKGKASITDRAGSYALNGVDGGFTVQVAKDGYEPAWRGVTVPQTVALDVQITPLPLSDSVNGNWTVTFEPEAGCPNQLAGNVRTYRANIVQHGAQLGITLSGPTFAAPPAEFGGSIQGQDVSMYLPDGCDFYCYYGPSGPPEVIEVLGANQFLAISGQITATAGPSSINGTLSGTFALTTSATPPFSNLATCSGERHRVTFTR